MSRRLDSTKPAEASSDERVDDQEGLDHGAKNDESEIDTACTTEGRKNRTSVIDCEGLNSMVADYHPSKNRITTRSARKRSIERTTPSTSGSTRPRTRRSSRKTDVTDTTVTHEESYKEDNDVKRKRTVLKFPTAKDSPNYNMGLKRRGVCVIFNQQEFDKGNGDFRKGSEFDVKSIERTFGNLDFEVTEHRNLTFYEVMDQIELLSNADYSDCDCICVFILTHGDRGDRVYARDACYPLSNIWAPFTAENCTTLAGKPKLFFVQACKGYNVEEGIQGRCATDSDDSVYTIPTNADFLFGFSTVEGYYSWRTKEEGTWYVQCLCKVIDEHWKDTDLLKMLTITARRVAFEYVSECSDEDMNNKKQMPSLMSTLTRDLYFTPKNHS